MSRRIVGPFNRVEGDLEVHLDIAGNEVRDAWVVAPLFRGFEQILQGKDPRDAMVYTPRICGICSVSQSVAAAVALADAQGLTMAPNGQAATNLVLGSENIADHLTHFYLFFMPDFAREVYQTEPWHAEICERFKAISGKSARQMLPARADFMHLMGIMAGKWPHSLALQPGGTTRPLETRECMRLRSLLYAFRQFLESVLFGDTLENIVAIESLQDLQAWSARFDWRHSDFSRFLHIASELQLEQMGRGPDVFMSYGAYRQNGSHLLQQGVWRDKRITELNPATISEDVSHGWMKQGQAPEHPYNGVTQPDADAADGYSWSKAPRLDGTVVEVGALARQLLAQHPLATDLVQHSGANVRNRVIGRLLEIAVVTRAMEDWLRELRPGDPWCNHGAIPDEAQGAGLIEAARGSLGHWLSIRNGRIDNYQIIAPTTWNFSPRDAGGTPGALEQALLGAPVREGETDPVAVQHIVRSFDPCMVCTVH